MSDLFQNNNDTRKHLYNKNYILYSICLFLYKNGESDYSTIFNYLNNIYCGNLKSSKIRRFIEEKFDRYKGKYSIKAANKIVVTNTVRFDSLLNYNYNNVDYDELIEDFFSQVRDYINDDNMSNFDKLLKTYLSINYINDFKEKDKIEYMYFTISSNFDNYINEIASTLGNINKRYYNIDISKFVVDKYLLEFLTLMNINNIGQLIEQSKYVLLVLFSGNIDTYLKLMNTLTNNYEEKMKAITSLVYANKSELEINILAERIASNNMTLEELGNRFNLTRERVRQIEAKLLRKLREIANNNQDILMLIFLMLDDGKHYMTFDEIKDDIKDEKISNAIITLFRLLDGNLKFQFDFHLLYDTNYIDFQGIIFEHLRKYGPVIEKKVYMSLDSFEKYIINENYRLIENGEYYLRKGLFIKDLYGILIRDYFKDGYRNEGVDFERLKRLAKEKFNIDSEVRGIRSTHGLIENNEKLVLCNRGTYKHIDNLPKIPSYLYDEMLNYIYKSDIAIYYSSIYSSFKKELNEIGIDNEYLLKGLLDLRLPEDLHHSRDYISIGEKYHTAYEAVIKYMRSFPSEFSLDDLRKKFPGVADSVFNSIIYGEENLICITLKEFIYVDKLGINEQVNIELKEYINDLFDEFETRTLSSRKIFARLKMFNKELFNKINMNGDHYELFSIIKYLYKNDYHFARPLISLDPIDSGSTYELVKTQFQDSDEFNYNDIKAYINAANLRGLYSYNSFMEDMSDEFVQVNIDSMVSKKHFEEDADIINKIDRVLELFLDRFKEINTNSFNGYRLFPIIKNYNWNKYLLIGIIRTFLNNKYEVENTDNMYNKTDFIVRRNNNEL